MRYFTPLCCVLLIAPNVYGVPTLAKPKIEPVATVAAECFDLSNVTLGAGPFREARDRDHAYLLRLDPDRLLHTFRLNVGLASTAKPYGGWESPDVELRGHSIGHYLSACALMYRNTGDEELKRRIDYIVDALAQCQAASPQAGFHEGYLSAFPETFIDRVEQRKEVWAPWYTLHKIMAGLLDAYRLTGNRTALDTLVGMAKWIDFRVGRLSHEQMQASLETEFGGMNEVLANLYSVTGDEMHLRLAHAFDHAAVFDPLARGEDALDGLHANTQIPKMIGSAVEYELTGDQRYRKIAETFWDRVALHRSYVTGGHSDREHFFPVADFLQHLSPETTETCNTYNMLKLTRHLFAWQPDARWMDFYERGLYNHILASQDPLQGMFVYLMALEPGEYKTYSTPENSFWCCVGTGMENHAKYADTIFAHDSDGIFVNLFIAAEASWAEKGLRLRQETQFPLSDATRLVWSCNGPVELALKIRHPSWLQGPLEVSINGVSQTVEGGAGGYAELKRVWRDGDKVDVKLPCTLHTEELPGAPQIQALLFGPIVLAGKLGVEDMGSPYENDQLDQAHFPHPVAPVVVTSNPKALEKIKLVSRNPIVFRTGNLTQPGEVELVPFYQLHHERSAVYWEILSPQAWHDRELSVASTEEEWKKIKTSAVDYVDLSDPRSESAHVLHSENNAVGKISSRGWREGLKAGEFNYRLKVADGKPLALVCAFGSRDRGNMFDILVDGQKIATPQLVGTGPGLIVLQRYDIPSELTAGKQTVIVKFQADSKWDASTANVFGCALVSQ